jgi:hypothetical protein
MTPSPMAKAAVNSMARAKDFMTDLDGQRVIDATSFSRLAASGRSTVF